MPTTLFGPRVVNLTPHAITVFLDSDEPPLIIPPSGIVARVEMVREQVGFVPLGDDSREDPAVPVYRNRPGEVTGLPPYREWGVYVVSRVVAEAARDRRDLFFPDDTVRDDQGRIIGCRALARL